MAGSGPLSASRQVSGDTLTLRPFGVGGVDANTNAGTLDPIYLALGENVRGDQADTSRRDGAVKVYQASDITKAKRLTTVAADGAYATISASPQLRLPAGSWASRFSCTVENQAIGGSATIITGVDGANAPPITVLLKSTGAPVWTIQATASWFGGGASSITSAALTAASTQHGLLFFNAPAGTLTLYLNGAVNGTPVTGISSSAQLTQFTGMNWFIGNTVANLTGYTGVFDALTLWSFAATKPSSGASTLVAAMLAHSARQWPNPMQDDVVFNYDCDSSGLTALIDSSKYKNHAQFNAVALGTASNETALALASKNTNHIGTFQTSTGGKYNVLGNYGRLFWERMRASA